MFGSFQNFIRYTLGILLLFAALNAFGGGYYGMAGAEGVPTEWLEGSPFSDYFIPGLILFVVVGGSFLFASIAVIAKLSIARAAVICSVIVVFVWLSVQIAIIEYVSWMQPATVITGGIILILSFLLPKVDHSKKS
ncbi:MAG: hypothetical protein RDU14_12800 [Melioribacteraceae bacterium]|nr:hypothetical protein [Melioribacteraceae bacterium]